MYLPSGAGRISPVGIGSSGGGGINAGALPIRGGGGINGGNGKFISGDPGVGSMWIGDGAFKSSGIMPSNG